MIVTQSLDLRSVTIGNVEVSVEFEPAAKRYERGRRYAGWRCYYRNLPARIWHLTGGKSDGNRRCETEAETFAFAASLVLAVLQGERRT